MTPFLRLKLSRGNIIAANIIQAMVNLKTVLLINFCPITIEPKVIEYECEAILLLCDSVNYNNIFLEKKKQKIDAHKQPHMQKISSHMCVSKWFKDEWVEFEVETK